MNLLEPTPKFIEYVFLSKDYLNCPKFILNSILDCIYRQFSDRQDLAIQHITDLLKKYKFKNPNRLANLFVEERKQIKLKVFDKLNINTYIDKTPEHIDRRHNYLNDWYVRHTKEEWRFGYMVSKHVPTYPYKTL